MSTTEDDSDNKTLLKSSSSTSSTSSSTSSSSVSSSQSILASKGKFKEKLIKTSKRTKCKIQAVFYSEFDVDKGPQIVCQYPQDYLSDSKFDAVSEFVINNHPTIKNKVMTVTAVGYKIFGVPMCIENTKYNRNEYLFNLGFVFDENDDPEVFSGVIRKAGSVLAALEVEHEYLTTMETRETMTDIVKFVYDGLNQHGELDFYLGQANEIHLKMFPMLDDPPVVKDFQVPVIVIDLDDVDTSNWDLTLQQLIPYIDGVRHVKRLAEMTMMNVDIVITALQVLIVYEVVRLIDIFQYDNVYVVSENVKELAKDETLQKSCIEYIILDDSQDAPSIDTIFSMLCAFKPGTTTLEVCQTFNPREKNINERKLVTFALLMNFLKREHGYPLLTEEMGPFALPRQREKALEVKHVFFMLPLLDGKHCLDDICCRLEKPKRYVASVLQTFNVEFVQI